MMNKLLNKLMGLFKEKENKETATVPPKPKVKRQNAVPPSKNIENKAHREMPKRQAIDRKVTEAKKKNENTKISDTPKPKKKYHRYKNFKNKKSTPTQTPGKKEEDHNKNKI